jgi:hypothetical protein
MRTQTIQPDQHLAYGFGTVSSKIIREYANGKADGFLNDLAAGHITAKVDSENALIDAFIQYVSHAVSVKT